MELEAAVTRVSATGTPSNHSQGSTEAFFRRLINLCRICGISPFSFAREADVVIKYDKFWKKYSIAATVSFSVLACSAVASLYSKSWFLSMHSMLVYLVLILSVLSLSYPLSCLYYGETLAKTLGIISRFNLPPSGIRRAEKYFRFSLSFLAFTILTQSIQAYCTVAEKYIPPSFMGLAFVLWDTFQVSISFLGEMKFTICVLLITAQLETLGTKVMGLTDSCDSVKRQYNDLYHSTRTLNKTFQIPLLFSVLSAFLEILISFYLLLTMELASMWLSSRVIMTCVYFVKLLALIDVCYSAREAADGTAIAVSSALSKPGLPAPLREELRDLSVQLLHMKLRFTACGFFPLDYTQLHAIIAAITTYLVILLQTQSSPQSSSLESIMAKTAAALDSFKNYTMECGSCGCCNSCPIDNVTLR